MRAQWEMYRLYSSIDMRQRLRRTPALHLAEEAPPRPYRRRRLSHVGPQVHQLEPGAQVCSLTYYITYGKIQDNYPNYNPLFVPSFLLYHETDAKAKDIS